MIRKIILTLAIVILPALGILVALPSPSSALFESSKNQACNGANLGATTAQGAIDCNDDAVGAGRISKVITSIVNILTIIVGVVAVIMIIINGLRFVTSNGDSNAITSAKNGIIYAIVGLIVVALAQVIVRFVLNRTSS